MLHPTQKFRCSSIPRLGDVIRGRGAGTLNISLNRKGEFRIYGDYLIEEGDYLFTLQNLLTKDLTLKTAEE